MPKHLFDRIEILATEVNLADRHRSAMVYLDSLFYQEELTEDMYAKIYEYCAELRTRMWVRGNYSNWDGWVANSGVMIEFYEHILDVVKEVFALPNTNKLAAAALYVRLANITHEMVKRRIDKTYYDMCDYLSDNISKITRARAVQPYFEKRKVFIPDPIMSEDILREWDKEKP